MNTAFTMNRTRLVKRISLPERQICRMLFGALSLLVAMAIISSQMAIVKQADAEMECVKAGLSERLYSNISHCAEIGKKMGYAGADIQFTLYPLLKHYLYAAFELNEAARLAFGEEYTPISKALSNKIQIVCTRLEASYQTGESAKEYEDTLCEYLRLFFDVLEEGFQENGILRFS